MKRCYSCATDFPPSGFHRGQNVCKKCNAARVKRWRHENPESARVQYRRNKARARKRKKLELASERTAVIVEPSDKTVV